MTNKNSGLWFRMLRATPAVEPAGAHPAENPGTSGIAGPVLDIAGASLPRALRAQGALETLGAQVSIPDHSHGSGRTRMTAQNGSAGGAFRVISSPGSKSANRSARVAIPVLRTRNVLEFHKHSTRASRAPR
jgi:hypothetical protein